VEFYQWLETHKANFASINDKITRRRRSIVPPIKRMTMNARKPIQDR